MNKVGFCNLPDDIDKDFINRLTKISRNHVAAYNQELQLTCWPIDQLKLNAEDVSNIEKVLQECLDNIGKHSNVETINLSIETNDNHCLIKVNDPCTNTRNDVYFKKDIYIKSIRQKTKKLDAFIISSVDNNTNFTIKIPIKK